MTSETTALPQPPSILRDLYGLSITSDIHPSIYYRDQNESTSASIASPSPHRPFVTLTFAQSLDAKIAAAGGKQLLLSGKESMVMTHWMRTLHDAILIGIGTALNDDPQLNTRHLPPLPADCPHSYRMPRPIVLDTHLRLSHECKLLKNYQSRRGRRPWVVCASQTRTASRGVESTKAFARRAEVLRQAGARIVEVAADAKTGFISVQDLLTALHEFGVRSVMVEGGASVIRSFLSAARGVPQPRDKSEAPGTGKIVDALVVTVAPMVVGDAGVGYGGELVADCLPTLKHVRTDVFGPDAVVAMKVL